MTSARLNPPSVKKQSIVGKCGAIGFLLQIALGSQERFLQQQQQQHSNIKHFLRTARRKSNIYTTRGKSFRIGYDTELRRQHSQSSIAHLGLPTTTCRVAAPPRGIRIPVNLGKSSSSVSELLQVSERIPTKKKVHRY